MEDIRSYDADFEDTLRLPPEEPPAGRDALGDEDEVPFEIPRD